MFNYSINILWLVQINDFICPAMISQNFYTAQNITMETINTKNMNCGKKTVQCCNTEQPVASVPLDTSSYWCPKGRLILSLAMQQSQNHNVHHIHPLHSTPTHILTSLLLPRQNCCLQECLSMEAPTCLFVLWVFFYFLKKLKDTTNNCKPIVDICI